MKYSEKQFKQTQPQSQSAHRQQKPRNRASHFLSGLCVLLSFYSHTVLASLAFVAEPMTWQEAQDYAQANFPNGQLVTVSDAQENATLMAIAQQHNTDLWIGYNDIGQEGQWQWISGQTSDFNPEWATDNPDNWTGHNPEGEDAAVILTSGLWQDYSTLYKRPFVVEYEESGALRYQFFDNIPSTVANFSEYPLDEQTPTRQGIIDNVDISQRPTGSDDYFAYRFSGEIYLSGEVTFTLGSDDGSNLYIGDELVILNDGRHSFRTLSTTLTLESGWYPIRLDYFERAGLEILELSYQESWMSEPQAIPSGAFRQGPDRDNDGYSDHYDRLFWGACNVNNLSNPEITDFRDCDFQGQRFPAGTYQDKVFDRSDFRGTNLSNVTFINSSFRHAVFTDQNSFNGSSGVEYDPEHSITFIDSDFSSAQVEQHWPGVRFYNVNFSNAELATNDSDNYDSSWICFERGRFLNSNLVRYDRQSTQDYELAIPGMRAPKWDIDNFRGHSCIEDIAIESKQEVSQLSASEVDIAPAIFTLRNLESNEQSYTVAPYFAPVSGNDQLPAFRTEIASTSPFWEWDLGRFYQLDAIRIYKNPSATNELDDAVVIMSEWPLGDSPLLQTDFDSKVIYQLTKTGKSYYEIPLSTPLRYIRIQRPINGTSQRLSFKRLAMFGDLQPLASATTQQPDGFVAPAFESNRPECEDAMFDSSQIDPNFDYISAIQPDANGRTYWNNADLSRSIRNHANFFWSELHNTNFEQSELVGADFKDIEGSGANFKGANLEGADFSGADLYGADFRGANLKDANFDSTHIGCAYFSGEIPSSYTPLKGEHETFEEPMISALAGNSAYGYARSSSIDLGGIPALAIDGDLNTSSTTAIETSPWWELDMGAIYVLSNVTLTTEYPIETAEKLALFISDWPLPFDFDGKEITGQVTQIKDFEIDPDDAAKIIFNTQLTGRFIHVRAPISLGEVRLQLNEVSALTPILPSAPSSNMPLTESQVTNLVPHTNQLINSIDSLIDSYQKSDPEDGIESAAESIGSLIEIASKTIDDSSGLIEIQRNFRKVTRPIDSSIFLIDKLKVIPPLKTSVDRFTTIVKPVKTVFTALNRSTHVGQQSINLLNHTIKGTINSASNARNEISSQVSILETGKSYINTLQRCALYGTESTEVRAALEDYSLQAAIEINDLINKIEVEKIVSNSTLERQQSLEAINAVYSSDSVETIRQTSTDVVDAMGPFAAAITPMQLLFSGGEIFEGLSIWDIIDLVSDVSDFFMELPFVVAILDFVDELFSPALDPIFNELGKVVDQLILGPLKEDLDSAQQGLDIIVSGLGTLADEVGSTEVYEIPNVRTDVFNAVMNLSGDSVFASCRESLNLPPQWPTPENDDDGDGLLNGFEVGYAPDDIVAVTNTLADNPDSDLDGLSDYFEWYWSTQAGENDLTFSPINGSLGEAERDDDNDGLNSLQEAAYGTNPYKADTDGDGINDGDEIKWNTNPLSTATEILDNPDVELDLDEDGVTILQEMAYQLDPIDPLDIYIDHDSDGVSTDQEIIQQSSPQLASPQLLLTDEIVIADPLKLADDIIISLHDWVDYNGTDLITIVDSGTSITEGSLEVIDPVALTLRAKIDPENLSSRYVTVLVKVKTEGGTLLTRILVNINLPDEDADGINDLVDNCVSVSNPDQANFDGDQFGDACDLDDDNDGVNDVDDAFPFDPTETRDTDGDGIGNNADPDDDNDGVNDEDDAFPEDPSEWSDSDGDGIGDNSDPTPLPSGGVIGLDSTEYFVSESASELIVTITRSDGNYGELKIDYALLDESAIAANDYIFQAGTLTFLDGQTSHTLMVEIIDDDVYEGDEAFLIRLNNARGNGEISAIDSARITIQENESIPAAGEISFESSELLVEESDGIVSVNVNRHGGSQGELQLNYFTEDGTAVVAENYQYSSGKLVFAEGETSKTIQVEVIDNDRFQPDKTFKLRLANLVGIGVLGLSEMTIHLLDDEPEPNTGVFEIEQSMFIVGESENSVDVVVNRIGGSEGLAQVKVSTMDGSALTDEDFLLVSETLVFEDGELSKSISIPVLDDSVFEDDEVFSVQLSDAVSAFLGNLSTANITIKENDLAPESGVIQFSGKQYLVDENSSGLLLTVVRTNGSLGDVDIDINILDDQSEAVESQDYYLENYSISLLSGETSHTVQLVMIDDDLFEGDEELSLALSINSGDALLGNHSQVTVTIVEDEPTPSAGVIGFSGASYSAKESDTSIVVTIQRTSGDYGDVSVEYSAQDGTAIADQDYSIADGVVYFLDGETSQEISVDLINDTIAEQSESFTLTLSNAMGASLSDDAVATVEIVDEDTVGEPPGDENTRPSGGGSLPLLWIYLAGLLLVRKRFR